MPEKEKKEKKPKVLAPKKAATSASPADEAKKIIKKKKEAKEEAEVVSPVIETPKVVSAPTPAGVALVDTDTEDMPADMGPGDGDMRPERYWEVVGRRKTAIARVRLFTRGEKGIFVNKKPYGQYFTHPESQLVVEDALKKMKSFERFRVTVKVSGGNEVVDVVGTTSPYTYFCGTLLN